MNGQMVMDDHSYVGGQMQMGQPYGSMVAPDGSQTYYTSMVVAVPQAGGQMPYAMPPVMTQAVHTELNAVSPSANGHSIHGAK